MNIKIYNCFHDHGSIPNEKYHSDIRPSLLCGADVEWRNTQDIICDFRDNTGENISKENEEYSELTGYYWIWKNDYDSDVIGIEHYRRHFVKNTVDVKIGVLQKDLFDSKDICDTLKKYDFILPVRKYMNDYSIYYLYTSCFSEEFVDKMIKYMKIYFMENKMKQYIDALYYSLSHNILICGNMLITNKENFNDYCTKMFEMVDYLKCYIPKSHLGRTWGYVTELFPLIYVMANNKKFKEVDIAVEDYDFLNNIVITTLSPSDNKGLLNRYPNEALDKIMSL